MDAILIILPLFVFLALLWFTYTNISYGVTVYRARKEDSTLSLCLSTTGKYFYIGLIIVYLIFLVTGIITGIVSLINNDSNTIYLILNVVTVASIAASFLLQQIIFVGHRQMMIGKIKLDYRKIKRVTYPKSSQLKFVYGQKTFQTSIRLADDFKLKKALQKSR